jgi:hypothetical protein
MSSANWTELTDGLDIATIDRGVTTGIARPNGGGNFVFGFNSIAVTTGAAAYFAAQANFAPTAKGGSIRGAIKRGVSGGLTGFAPFLFIGLQGPSVNDAGYMLGLQDDNPHRIALRKGTLISGLPSGTPGTSGILARSNTAYAVDTWLHLRLDMIVNLNGDVILKCYESDLTAHAVTAPTWGAIGGLDDFVDDALAVNSGSAPYTAGRVGYGFRSQDIIRRGFFDQIEVLRQL